MTTIVTRAGKGSPLTNAEVDQNFLNLNSAKLEAGDLSPYLLSATAASTYQTIAGMSSYLTTAGAASTYFPLSGGSVAGNLDFSGANRRITGDFTSTSRVLVQTTSANSNTVFGLIPNGTAVNSQFHVWGASDITNAPIGAFTINSASVQIQSSAAGTGTVLPFRVLIGSTETFRVSTGFNFLIGTSTDNATDKLQVNGTIKSLTGGFVFPDGTTQTTAASGSAVFPAQTGNAGKFLQTNGTNVLWASLPTNLPVYTYAGTTTQISVANGYFPVTTYGGSTVNVSVT